MSSHDPHPRGAFGRQIPCSLCGLKIERRLRYDSTPDGSGWIDLQPGEFTVRRVPDRARWHLASGVAWPGADRTPWCRLDHAAVCPAADEPEEPVLRDARRRLAVRACILRSREAAK